jgi:dTMP kinase
MTAARRPGGFFITFEGPEGSGKSTQSNRLEVRLNLAGVVTVTVREPGGTELGEQVRKTLLGFNRLKVSSWSEACLFSAARAQLATEVIGPTLQAGHVVICDRYSDSTMAYQGYGRGLDLQLLRALQDAVTGGVRPQLTFLLDLPVEEGLQRIPQEHRDRLDREVMDFHRRVREGYQQLAAKEPDRWVTVDARRAPDNVADEVFTAALQHLGRAGILPGERSA